MKKLFINIMLPILALGLVLSCEKEQDYDISWPVPTISEVSSYSAAISSTITLKGNFTKLKSVSFGGVEGLNVQVADDEQSLTVGVPRNLSPDGGIITISNQYRQTAQTSEAFVPSFPTTVITEVGDIQAGLSFTIKGENVDLLRKISLTTNKGKEFDLNVLTKTPNSILVSVAGTNLKAGELVDLKFRTVENKEVAAVKQVSVVYQFITYTEIAIWDFEDNAHVYVGEGTASIESGDVLGTTEKYFSLRAPGYGWDKLTGEMAMTEKPEIATINDPYLTFCIRTPKGSAGYFQMEDQAGNWRHFGYGFDTGGEWKIISLPLSDSWEGGEFNIGAFNPKLGFKAGNADTKQDLDIAYVKITEGKFDGSQKLGDVLAGSAKPARLAVMDFDTKSEWPDLKNGENTVGSTDFRKEDVSPFYGNGFFSFIGDGTIADGSWGAYWGASLSKDMKAADLSAFTNPYLSFALNSNDKQQYIIVRIYQYDEQLVLIQKFFPQTNGTWSTYQFSLFGTDMENWSEGDTDLSAHYKSLKRFNKDVPIDRIEVIASKNAANPIVISIDEMVITEGPRY